MKGMSTCAGHWPRHSCDFYAFRLRVVSGECFGGRFSVRPLPGSTSLFSVATDAPTSGGLLPRCSATLSTYPVMPQGSTGPPLTGARAFGSGLRSRHWWRRLSDVCSALAFLRTRFISPDDPLYDARCGFPILLPPHRGFSVSYATGPTLRLVWERLCLFHGGLGFCDRGPLGDPSACPTASSFRHGLFDRGKDLFFRLSKIVSTSRFSVVDGRSLAGIWVACKALS